MTRIVLLGDSVFDNGLHVPIGYDVGSQLSELLPSLWSVDVLAEDGATASDTEWQLSRLPEHATHLVLSAGGNDALLQVDLLGLPSGSTLEALGRVYEAAQAFKTNYGRLVRACMKSGMRTAVCTIYEGAFRDKGVPEGVAAALAVYNDVIYRVAAEQGLPIFELRLICGEDGDFVKSIEPSVQGGRKIAQAIARAALCNFRSDASILR